MPIQGRIHVREQGQSGRDDVAIQILHLVEDNQPGEVHVREFASGDDVPVSRWLASVPSRPLSASIRLGLIWSTTVNDLDGASRIASKA